MLRSALVVSVLTLSVAAQGSRPARDLRTLAAKAARAQKLLLARFEARPEPGPAATTADAAPAAVQVQAGLVELDRTIADDPVLAPKFAKAFQIESWSVADPEGAELNKALGSPCRGSSPGLALIDRTGELLSIVDVAGWKTAGRWDPARIAESVDFWTKPLPKSNRFAELKKKYGALYDPKADAAADVDAAVAKAKAEGKHVLVKVGFNNCPWCYFLHDELESRPELGRMVAASYVLVRVSCDGDNRNEALLARLELPGRFGYPVLVVLDAEGRRLHTQDSGLLEVGDHHDPRRVAAFLRGWTPAALQPPKPRR